MTKLKIYLKPLLEKNNAQLVTKAKIKRAESGKIKGITINKRHNNLKDWCVEMPTSF